MAVEQVGGEGFQRNRLDEFAVLVDGVAVDALEQAPLAPLHRDLRGATRRVGKEMPLHGEALALQGRERGIHRLFGWLVRTQAAEAASQIGRGHRAEAAEAAANEVAQGVLRGPVFLFQKVGQAASRRRIRAQRAQTRQHFRRQPECAALVDSALGQQFAAERLDGAELGRGHESQGQQGVVEFLWVADRWPGFGLDPLDGFPVEDAEIVDFARVEPGAVADGVGAALLEGGVVEEGVGPRVDDFLGEGGRLAQIPAHQREPALFHVREQGGQPIDIHGFGEAVVDRLVDERVIGNLALAGEVLLAGDLVREHVGDQILGVHPLPLRRHAVAIAVALDRQRAGGVPAPAQLEHRRVEHRLHHDLAHGLAVEIAEDFIEWKTVDRTQREHDVVLVGGGLQLEIE